MRAFAVVGAFFILAGLALLVFPRALGTAFCRVGKATSRRGRNPIFRAVTEQIYDESAAPRKMRSMGWVILVQGLMLLAFGLYYK
jgi:hypothetical protein